jgi:hypothetical protein
MDAKINSEHVQVIRCDIGSASVKKRKDVENEQFFFLK